MDKKIWLKVIRDELTLLDELATGMIGDISLSREEVELAISRSKIVVKEFEMLLSQISPPENAAKAEYLVDEPTKLASLPVSESPSLLVSHSPILPVSESPSPEVTPSLPSPPEPPSFHQDDLTEYTQYFKIEPLKSLKEGLSLNDRYLFQRELFNNNKSSLDETIATLDRFHNIKEAVDYLKANFKWNKSEASEKFVQLVKRRFS